jgi:methyl-accepting chemotaxis protein
MTDHAEQYLSRFATQAAGLGRASAEIAGALDDLSSVATAQTRTTAALAKEIRIMVASNQEIHQAAHLAEKQSGEARVSVERALGETRMLATAVSRVEDGIASVSGALKQVARAAEEIGQIAFQTRIVAFNASVEAVRAGEAGKGFGVVADAVKELAQRVQSSSQMISTTVAQLNDRVEQLAQDVEAEHDGRHGNAEAAVDAAIDAFRSSFGAVAEKIHKITEQAKSNLSACDSVTAATHSLERSVAASNRSIDSAKSRADDLLGLSESLIEIGAESGVETEDTPFIRAVTEAAAEMGAALEDALKRGMISKADLFDEHYAPVTGSNPQQHLARFTTLTDRLFPPIQEALLGISPLVAFCAAVDRNGYLPTHNLKFSKPQGNNPEWNAANCRNRRIFNDATGLAAGRNQQPFLLQTYRRDMGGGRFVTMKDLSAPIIVNGRHWGGLRMGVKFE